MQGDDLHDPVKQVRRIQEFQNMMKNLQDVLRKSLNETSNFMTYYKRLVREIKEEDDDHIYQGIKVTHFENNVDSVKYEYQSVINLLIENVNSKFTNLQNSAVFKNIVRLLDLRTWPTSPDSSFCEAEINEISEEFADLLSRNNCEIPFIPEEWVALQAHLIPLVANNPNEHYLNVWKRVLTNKEIKIECKNVLHIFEILLYIPFTNAKVERGFSMMARVKTNFRSQLSRSHLSACFRISEEGLDIKDFIPDPAIDIWYQDKVRRLGSSSHKYKKGKATSTSDNTITDLATVSLSDLESDDADNADEDLRTDE